MNRSTVNFHRLVARQAVEMLFSSFAPLLQDSPVALLDSTGRAMYGDWPAAEGERGAELALMGETGSPFALDGAIYYALLVQGELIGMLAARVDSAPLRALRGSLALLLKQGQEKRELARETLERYREINLVYHISNRLGASLDADEILRISLSEAQRTIRADSGLVMLWEQGESLTAPPGQFSAPRPARMLMAGSEPAARSAQEELERRMAENTRLDTPNILSQFADPESCLASLLYAPVLSGGVSLGVLCLARVSGKDEFTAGDEKLLAAVASQAGSAVEKAYLHQHELERQRVEQELVIGERIQRSLLPRAMPALPGWDFAASYQSAGQVGGDFYDIFPLSTRARVESGGMWAAAIADVTGKGIPAALMMAFSQAALRASAATQRQPAEVLAQTNRLILQNGRPGLLLTAFFAALDPASGLVQYSNGGHEPPILYRAGSRVCSALDCGQSTLIGAYPNRVFPQRSVVLNPGDALLLYTDGITEARSSSGDFYTEERLMEVLQACGGCASADLVRAVQDAVHAFTAGAKQSDDMTMLVIKRL